MHRQDWIFGVFSLTDLAPIGKHTHTQRTHVHRHSHSQFSSPSCTAGCTPRAKHSRLRKPYLSVSMRVPPVCRRVSPIIVPHSNYTQKQSIQAVPQPTLPCASCTKSPGLGPRLPASGLVHLQSASLAMIASPPWLSGANSATSQGEASTQGSSHLTDHDDQKAQ